MKCFNLKELMRVTRSEEMFHFFYRLFEDNHSKSTDFKFYERNYGFNGIGSNAALL